MGSKVVAAKGNIFGSLIPARYVLAILGSVAMAIIYGLKVNLSVTMVAMLNHTAIKQNSPIKMHNNNSSTNKSIENDVCPDNEEDENIEDGPFDWSEPLQGTILSCYFWGYFISQIPGAMIAENFSAKKVMLFSVLINIICTFLTPVMATLDYIAMITMRIAEGIGGGMTFPAMHVMLAQWAPPVERSVMSSIVYSGTALGTVSSMLLSGFLAGSVGWKSVFYVMAALSCIWIVLWILLIQDTPNEQALISPEERQQIIESLGSEMICTNRNKPPIPWREIFKSGPFIAILITHACFNWGWYILLLELPFYMKQILKLNIKENAVAIALPFLGMWIFSLIFGRMLDYLRSKGAIDTTKARKVSTFIASFGPILGLLTISNIGCQRSLTIVLMGISITTTGGMFSGFLSNHIDIAPNYAGTLIALTNTVATLPGIIVPIFVGQITHGNQTLEAWQTIFYVTVGLYLMGIFVYCFLASGKEQRWNKDTEGTPLNIKDSSSYMSNE